MASKIKPGTKHPSKPGMVMGTNSRYVSKSTYNKQIKGGTKPATKPAVKKKVSKPTPTKASASSTPKVGATKRLQGRMVRWNGKRWTAAGTGPKQPATKATSKATPKATPRISSPRLKAPSIPKPKSSTPKPKASTPKPKSSTPKPKVKLPKIKLPKLQLPKVQPPKKASRSASAVSRALRRTGARTSIKGGLAGIAMTAAEIAARKGALGNSVKNEFEQGDARMDRFLKNPLKKDTTNERKPKTASSKTEVKPASKKPSDYPTNAVTKTVKKGRDYQAEAKAKAAAAKKKASSSSNPPASKIPKPPAQNSMKDASASSRMAAWAKANRKMIEKAGTKKQKEILAKLDKKKKPNQSAANKAGYPGNRNY